MPIEPRALLASYDAANERITLRASSQTPAGLRDTLCTEVLGIARTRSESSWATSAAASE